MKKDVEVEKCYKMRKKMLFFQRILRSGEGAVGGGRIWERLLFVNLLIKF